MVVGHGGGHVEPTKAGAEGVPLINRLWRTQVYKAVCRVDL